MRVALVSPYALDVVGGVQAHVLALADALRRLGDEVLVVGPSAGATPSRMPAGARIVDVGRSIPVPVNGSRAPIALSPATAMRVGDLLRRADPDVIHVHEPLVPVVGPAAVLATGAPRVLTFHASAEGGALPPLYRAIRGLARRIVAHGDVLTAVSAVAADFHARALGLDVGRFAIIPNGVDVARFASAGQRREVAAPPRRLVFLGRLEHRKGADVVVRAFLRLAAAHDDVTLRVIGEGPLAPVLRRLVDTAPAHVAARVELCGRAAPDALPELLIDVDIAVLPARGGESFGIVLLEAMAAGLPIVATDIPGYRAVARQGQEAILVAPDDPAALAEGIGRILADAEFAGRLRAAGTLRAAEHDWGAVAGRVRGLYEAARSGGPSGR
jgi:phosphatidylinositol alpha-mannosyltransferase